MPYFIYLTPSRDRFFLLPSDQELPAGDFVIQTVDKRELRVSEEALREFEIPKEQAHELLEKEMRESLQQARDAFSSMPQASTPATPPKAEDLLRSLLQLPKGQEASGDNLRTGLRSFLSLLSDTLEVAVSDDPGAQAKAEEKLTALRTTLENHGMSTDKPIEGMPSRLAEWRNDPKNAADREKAAALAEQLKKLAKGL